ncbi:MAG: hypothetical protein ACR2LC_01440 [Pyrinomonadaceae bacterium]
MKRIEVSAVMLLMFACESWSVGGVAEAQQQQRRAPSSAASRRSAAEKSLLTGVYRLDVGGSDKLYSVVSTASSNLPPGEQGRFFDDLTIRLAAPDQLAIERRGFLIDIASSRAPRLSFEADGIERTEQATDGRTIRTRAALLGEQLTVSTSGTSEDKFTVVFEAIDEGRRLRVTRRIAAAGLNQPVVIRSLYNKVSDIARWSIYGETQPTPLESPAYAEKRTTIAATNRVPAKASTVFATSEDADALRASLDAWISATNGRDIDKQLTFYLPRVDAYYLARNVSREFVRADKSRVFARASAVDVRAATPEIIFDELNRTAVMRFRKRYAIEGGTAGTTKRGEVIQELRWRRTREGWKIASERDVRVLR